MGVVYLARDPRSDRPLAIKTIALGREFADEERAEARQRFLREAETAARLRHADIVSVLDSGEDQGLAWIAMEFLSGHDLQRHTQVGTLLPVPVVLRVASRVSDALAYAHRQGVVHRDVKPANVMVDLATDSVKVTDFGIARIADASRTRTGMVLGTPSFMSPEQMAGRRIDGRSDLYSLGVMLFQLLCGRLPHRADSMAALMSQIVNQRAPNIRSLRPELPEALADLVALAAREAPRTAPCRRPTAGARPAADRHPDGRCIGARGTPRSAWRSGPVCLDREVLTRRSEAQSWRVTPARPPHAMTLEFFSATDTGRARNNNEDSVAVHEGAKLLALADGMGGYNAGEVASGMVTSFIKTELGRWLEEASESATDAEVRRAMDICVDNANRAIFNAANSNPQYAGMGTTLVVAVFRAGRLLLGHVGDSRAYRLRGGRLSQATHDHSLLQEQIDAGLITAEQASFSANKNLVTRAVGVEDTVLLETHVHEVMPGDVYLLCSDGLSDMLDDESIGQLLHSHRSLAAAGAALIDAANDAGGKDNIAVILARVDGVRAPAARSWWPFRR